MGYLMINWLLEIIFFWTTNCIVAVNLFLINIVYRKKFIEM